MERLRVGVVGCGARGRRHIACLKDFPDVRIEAVCDPSERNVGAAAELAGAPLRFTSLDAFLETPLDAVVLSVPASLNGPLAKAVLGRGLATLLEKPPALSLAETKELLAIARRTGARAMVGVNRRYHPLIAEALDAVRARGPIVQIVAEFHKSMDRQLQAGIVSEKTLAEWPNALLLESPIHAIDLTRYIAGSPITRMASAARRSLHVHADVHAALVEFESGCVASLTFNYTGDDRLERYEIHGDRISVYLENSLISGTTMEVIADDQKVRTTRITDSGLSRQNRAFIDGVRSGLDFVPPAPGLEEALETMALAEAIGFGQSYAKWNAR